jgi:hypothetical protein
LRKPALGHPVDCGPAHDRFWRPLSSVGLNAVHARPSLLEIAPPRSGPGWRT